MKKYFLLLLMIAASYTLIAQVKNPLKNNTFNSGIAAAANAALPVLETYVSPALITKMKSTFRDFLYDITTIEGPVNKKQYVVRSFKSGQLTTEYFDEDGNLVPSSLTMTAKQ